MSQNNFQKRKQDVLSKLDKSSKQSWDEKILKLCEKINSLENYYTTSSCAGRVVIMIDKLKKESGLFLKVYHDLISLSQLRKDLDRISCSLRSQDNKIINRKSDDNDDLAEKSGRADFGAAKNGLIKFNKSRVFSMLLVRRWKMRRIYWIRRNCLGGREAG